MTRSGKHWLKFVLVLLCLMLLSTVRAQDDQLAPDGEPGERYYAPFPVPISVDGDLIDWRGVPTVTIPGNAGPEIGKPGVTFAATADTEFLYVMGIVYDDNIISGHHEAEYWREDSLEFYLNGTGNLALTTYETGVVQIIIPALNVATDETVVVGIEAAAIPVTLEAVQTQYGWVVELAVPLVTDVWNISPQHGQAIGFQVHLNGASQLEDRDTKLIWSIYDTANESWQNPSVFGQLVFFEIGHDAATAPDTASVTSSCSISSAGDVNIRSGPGLTAPIVGTLSSGVVLAADARSIDGWYRVSFSGGTGWVSGTVVQTQGMCNALMVVNAGDVAVGTETSPAERWVWLGGPPGGLGYDIRYNFGNPDIWYVTDGWAGVFISIDNGYTWFPSNEGITARAGGAGDAIPVFSLTVDPNDPNILWTGMQYIRGIFKSTNGGQTWTRMDNGIVERDGISFRGFTVDPHTSDIVYAAAEISSWAWAGHDVMGVGFDMTKGVVYRTTDGGQYWTAIWRGDNLARYVWVDPRDSNVIYISTGIFDREAANSDPNALIPGGEGIIKSTDGGQTWNAINNGLDNLYVGSLFMHPDNPDILLAGTGNIAYSDHAGVYWTTDGGAHWTHVLETAIDGERAFITSVELCPSDPNIGYAASQHAVYRSNDAGQTWTLVSGSWGGAPPGVAAGFSIDLQCDPRNPDRIFSNNYDGGNFLSEDGGRTWQNASQGYSGAQMRWVAVDPDNPAQVYGAGRNGLWRSDDGGTVWYGLYYPPRVNHVVSGVEWATIVADPAQSGHLLASQGVSPAPFIVSPDGGLSWRYSGGVDELLGWEVLNNRGYMHVIVFAPSDSSIVYGGVSPNFCVIGHEPWYCNGPGGFLYSHDGGISWQSSMAEMIRDAIVIDLAVDPGNPQIVYAATGEGLLKTIDGGTNWTRLGGPLDGALVRTVAVSPTDSQYIIAGIEALGTYISTDGGQTWQAGIAGLEANNSLHDIVFDPTDAAVVYVSDYKSGVYRSTDGGRSWRLIAQGMRNRSALGLAISADGQHLYAAIDGEGVYRLDLNGQAP